MSEYVRIEQVTIGEESTSGLAVRVEIDGAWHWVPFSQIKALHRNPRVKGEDAIEVTRWLAEKHGWE